MLEQLRAEPGRRHDSAELGDKLEQLGQRRPRLPDPHESAAASRLFSESREADQESGRRRLRPRDQGSMPKKAGEVPRPRGEASPPGCHELSVDPRCPSCGADASLLSVLHHA